MLILSSTGKLENGATVFVTNDSDKPRTSLLGRIILDPVAGTMTIASADGSAVQASVEGNCDAVRRMNAFFTLTGNQGSVATKQDPNFVQFVNVCYGYFKTVPVV